MTVDLSQLNLNQLVALEALLTERHVGRAAQRMGVTQSAMSHTLRALRHLLNDPLLVRVGNGMEPTTYAEGIAPSLRRGLVELQTVVQGRAAFRPESVTDEFSLASHDALATQLLPLLYAGLRERAPNAGLKVVAVEDHLVKEQLLRGDVDVALLPPFMDLSGLETRPLVGAGNSLVSSMQQASKRRRLTLQAYCRQPHAVVSIRGEGKSFVDDLLAERGLSRRIAVRVPFVYALPELIAESDLLATLPTPVAHALAQKWPLRVFDFPIKLAAAPLLLCWHGRFSAEPAGAFFRELVSAALLALDERVRLRYGNP